MARSSNAHKAVKDNSEFFQYLYNISNQHDIASSQIYALVQQNGLFKEHIPTLMINKSAVPFIIPMDGCYMYAYGANQGYILLPIDPYKAILLFPPSASDLYIQRNRINYGLIISEAIAKRLNQFLFEAQIMEGYGYIISNDLDTTKETADEYIKDNKDSLCTSYLQSF